MKPAVIVRLLLAIIVMGVAASCSSHRQAVEAPQPSRGKVSAKPVGEVSALGATYEPWQTFYAPFTLRLSRPASMSISGRATMMADSVIYLSMRMLGMEVATVWVDPDSVYVADKFHRTLVVAPFSALSARTSLTLADLQSMLLGRAFYPGRGTVGNSDKSELLFSTTARSDGSTILTPRRVPDGATWYFTIDNRPVLTRLTVEPDGLEPFTVDFEGSTDTPGGTTAAQLSLAGAVGNMAIAGSLDWNLGRAGWNDGRTASRPSYNGYRRVSLSEFVKSLKSF